MCEISDRNGFLFPGHDATKGNHEYAEEQNGLPRCGSRWCQTVTGALYGLRFGSDCLATRLCGAGKVLDQWRFAVYVKNLRPALLPCSIGFLADDMSR